MTNSKTYFIRKAKRKNLANLSVYYDTFPSYLQSRNLQTLHIERYQKKIDRFTLWLSEHREITPDNAEKRDILDYLQYLQEKRNAVAKTRAHILGAIRHYYTFLLQKGEVTSNPTNLIKLRGTRKKILYKILSLEELNEFLDIYYLCKVKNAPDERRHHYTRNYLILSLFAYQGITRNQIKALSIDDLDLRKGTITIPANRRKNARTIPLQSAQTGIFYDFMNNVRPLFKENGNLINSVPDLQKLIASTKKIYPKFTDFKQLRASIITHWIQTEGLRKAQYKAGHKYISSTEEYIANDFESLKNDINKFHPL